MGKKPWMAGQAAMTPEKWLKVSRDCSNINGPALCLHDTRARRSSGVPFDLAGRRIFLAGHRGMVGAALVAAA